MAEEFSVIADRWEAQLLAVAKRSMELASEEVIGNTPVLYGALKASWTATNGPPLATNRESGGVDFLNAVNSISLGDTYSFANGQPYAPRIEHEGWSMKAADGMIGPMADQWQMIVDHAVRENQ